MDPITLAIVALSAAGLVAVLWAARRRRRRARPQTGTLSLHGLREREFEALVAEAFKSQGYETIASTAPQSAAFGGLVMRRERTTYLIECRHWRDGKVGAEAVRALHRAMISRGATAGFILTSGRLGREAVALAAGCNVQAVEGPKLETLLARAKGR